ncbi:hypothetical protein [Clostridium botulinum]|uniref:hypothetical protein n=1 Tax=Clostridium botulinum TaxID=1491 RepID=UPI000D3D37EA|nr:hypothetical protein [Clostridium botulinum]AWB17244.1 hypothetical protein DB732_07140 [Clostridium botulinum]AWB30036.1 hypothetical protein DBN47_07120 [Clostridium botulinum]EGT5616403.1 hypothetical protein [Clostridium botulinum]EGT5623156.1 hypothetical protein [Clostridium botulinum]EGT5626294.1 hypothetical protein [Clostridium botulinum]
MAKKQIENVLIDGQVSIWDIDKNIKKSNGKPVIKLENKEIKINNIEQGKIIAKYKTYENLNRIIGYAGGALGIEIKYKDRFETIYVNKKGEEEFVIKKKSSVLPWDKIIYFREDLKINNIQKEKIKKIKGQALKRPGDENIIFNQGNKVISVIENGWVLEYDNIKIAELEKYKKINADSMDQDFKKTLKLGNIVETEYKDEIIQGKVVHIYNNGYTCNIIEGNRYIPIPICGIRQVIA